MVGSTTSVQAGIVLELLRVLYLVPTAVRNRLAPRFLERRISKPTPTVTHFLPQGHTF